MGFRLLRTFALPALACAVAISMASAAASAADAKATVKAVAKGRGITVSSALPGGAVAGRATSILGAAWNADNTPIPAAKIRLRNVLTGRIEATSVANDLGQFTFDGMESGSYVIELVSDSGKILAIGPPVHGGGRRDRRHVRAAGSQGRHGSAVSSATRRQASPRLPHPPA